MPPTRPTSKGEDEERLTPVDRHRQVIGGRLRELRKAAGFTQMQLADKARIAQASVSQYEAGRWMPPPTTFDRIARALRLSAAQAVEVRDLLAELTIEVKTLRVTHRQGGERAMQAAFADAEASAKEIWAYQDEVIPGLLQTTDYTRAMVPLIFPELPDLDDLVAGRALRQEVLFDASKRFRFLIHESVLRARVAPDSVLRAQLDRLVQMHVSLPHVEIRVLPQAALLSAWVMTSFRIRDNSVGIELQAGSIEITDPREVDMYRERYEALWRLGVAGEEMAELVRAAERWYADLAE